MKARKPKLTIFIVVGALVILVVYPFARERFFSDPNRYLDLGPGYTRYDANGNIVFKSDDRLKNPPPPPPSEAEMKERLVGRWGVIDANGNDTVITMDMIFLGNGDVETYFQTTYDRDNPANNRYLRLTGTWKIEADKVVVTPDDSRSRVQSYSFLSKDRLKTPNGLRAIYRKLN